MKNVADGVIGATSQQYPLQMAALGIEAIAQYAKDGTLPAADRGQGVHRHRRRPSSPTSRSTASSRSRPPRAWRSAGADPHRADGLRPRAGRPIRRPVQAKPVAWRRRPMTDTKSGMQDFEKAIASTGRSPPSSGTTDRSSNGPARPALEPGAGAADRAAALDRPVRRARRRALLLGLLADADPPAGGDRRHRRLGADPRGPDRRHRPLGRRDHGALLRRHGPVHLPLRHPGADLDPLRLRRRRARRLHQRLPRRPGEAAALHRHARHVADRPRRQLPLFRERDDPGAGHRDQRPAPPVLRTAGQVRRRGLHLRRHRHGAARPRAQLRAHPHGLGAARLRDRRRSRVGAARRRPGAEDADLGLRARRPDLRPRRLGADRPHRLGLARRPASSPTSRASPRW